MQRVLRFPLDFFPGSFTWPERLLLPFVMAAHLVLGLPYFLYGLLTIPSRRMNQFHVEHNRQQRQLWEQRESLRRRSRVIEGEALVTMIERGTGTFLRNLHTGQHWWLDAEPASLRPLSSASPLLENPRAQGQEWFRDLLDEEYGRAMLLEFPNNKRGQALEERIPRQRLLNIGDLPFTEAGPAIFCHAQPTEEDIERLFPPSADTEFTKPEDRFWSKYWTRIGIGYLAFMLLLVLPLLALSGRLALGDLPWIGGLWLLADFCLIQLLMAWDIRHDFGMTQERSWWRPIFRWVMPWFSVIFIHGFVFWTCYEAGQGMIYSLCFAWHLLVFGLWRWLMPRWHDPFAIEVDGDIDFGESAIGTST